MKKRASISAQLLAAFVDGEVTPSESERIEAELAASSAAQRTVSELRRLRQTLSGPVPELESQDLVAAVRASIASEPTDKPRARGWKVGLGAALAAACALALLQRSSNVAPTDGSSPWEANSEFRAKSDAPTRATRWAGIQAYSVIGDAPAQALTGRLSRQAGLLFAYTNLGPEPFEYLMIFATDARGEVHWCYPAYVDPGTNPTSVRIRKGEATVPLGELIRLDLAPGPTTLYALFSMQPLRVLDVEAWLRRPRAERAPEHATGTVQQVFQIEVEP